MAGTKHVVTDHVCIIFLLSTHIVGEQVDSSLSEVLRLVPQAWTEEQTTSYGTTHWCRSETSLQEGAE